MSNLLKMMMAGAAEVKYRYFRLNCTANNGDATFVTIGEIDWMVNGTAHPTSAMTTNTAPSPLVASASGIQGADEPYRAYDNSTGFWQDDVTTGWVKIDLGAGNEITPTSAKVAYENIGAPGRMVKDFTLEGSNTGSFSGEETILKTVTGETGWAAGGETREFTF